MAYNYASTSQSSWDPNNSYTLGELKRAKISNNSDYFRNRYLTKGKSYFTYDFYDEFKNTVFEEKYINGRQEFTYLHFAAMGRIDDGATRYIIDYMTRKILPMLPRTEIPTRVNLASVCEDINRILKENDYSNGPYQEVRNRNSSVTPFIEEL